MMCFCSTFCVLNTSIQLVFIGEQKQVGKQEHKSRIHSNTDCFDFDDNFFGVHEIFSIKGVICQFYKSKQLVEH